MNDGPPPETRPSLAKRSLVSLSWNAFAGLVTLPIGFVQTVLLARLLPVEDFGIFAGLAALVNLSFPIFEFGFSAAALHRSPQTQDEDRAMGSLFLLRLISVSIWAVALGAFGALFFSGLRLQVLVVLIISNWLLRLSLVGQILLIRRVEHRRLALLDILQTVLVFGLSVSVAWLSGSIWALALGPGAMAVVNWIFLAVYQPVWRPRLAWDLESVRYFLNFGSRTVGGLTLATALDYVDDLWTNYYLGDVALGFYSRAYRFAAYPRVILAEPVNSVTVGMYAELKGDRRNLSRAFFRINALLIRIGFLLAGWLAVIAPHLILLFLGEKWMPMLAVFRLMLIYTLLDPIKITVANVLIASGRPGLASLARLAQFLILIVGLYALGPIMGIIGVAVAVDGMLAAGILLLLIFARRVVDYSALRLFFAPVAALGVALAAGKWVGFLDIIRSNEWVDLLIKSVVVVGTYTGVLLLLEMKALLEAIWWAIKIYGEQQVVVPALHDPGRKQGSEL